MTNPDFDLAIDQLGFILRRSGWLQDEEGDWCLAKGSDQPETRIARSAQEAIAIQEELSND